MKLVNSWYFIIFSQQIVLSFIKIQNKENLGEGGQF